MKKGYYIALLASLLLITSGSKAQNVFNLWDGMGVSQWKFMPPCLTVYAANSTNNTHVAVIICPGGSYHHLLGIKEEGYDVAKWFQNQGINAFVLRYRVGFWGFHHPAMIEDLQRSIQFVKENAQNWGIDTTKVGLIGFSAGGHLVASGGTFYNEDYLLPLGIKPKVSLRPNFVVPVYPVISMQDSIAHKRSRKNLLGANYSKEQEDKMSLEEHINPDEPPTMVVVTKDDPVVDWRNGYYYYINLHKAGVTCKLLLNEKGGHGFGIDQKKGGKAALWNVECIKWLHEIGILPFYLSSSK